MFEQHVLTRHVRHEGALHAAGVVVEDTYHGETGLAGVCNCERVQYGVSRVHDTVRACVDCSRLDCGISCTGCGTVLPDTCRTVVSMAQCCGRQRLNRKVSAGKAGSFARGVHTTSNTTGSVHVKGTRGSSLISKTFPGSWGYFRRAVASSIIAETVYSTYGFLRGEGILSYRSSTAPPCGFVVHSTKSAT